jgi:HD-like signal output (HDOD) protein
VHGFTHAEAGGYLLALWGLPYPIVEAVAHHHHPSRSQEPSFGPIGALHVADRLSHHLPPSAAGFDLEYLDRVQVRDRLEAWSQLVANDPPA